MAVTEPDKLDAMGIDGDTLVLMISDHLVWDRDPAAHLMFLRDKLNAYVRFIEDEGWRDSYGKKDFSRYVIEVHFRYPYPQAFVTMVNMVKDQLDQRKIRIRYMVESGDIL